MTTVLDLFAGCGGLSLGFQRAGYTVLAGVDVDDVARKTYEHNIDAPALDIDLSETSPEAFFERVPFGPDDIDVVCGGPPCKGYSYSGYRDPDDDRNALVYDFVDYVRYIRPSAFLMENVRGLLDMEGGSVVDGLVDEFRGIGYDADYRKLNAAEYGVPQSRKRVFVVGMSDGEPEFPEPTHYVE